MRSGILCMNKPEGFTSFDVIGKLRGILRMKKLGHAGTLDPMATGVLPVFVGGATRASSIMTCNEKSYEADFKLGIRTDTEDITGSILKECEFDVPRGTIENVLPNFRGKIKQVPPMYSAVSVNGKRLYELARQGKEVERPEREVEITALDLLEFNESTGEGKLFIACTKGTYVRTIIADIGEKLGCGATMTKLKRTSSNGFNISECYTFEDVERLRDEGKLDEIIIPCDRVFDEYPKIKLNPKKTEMYRNGVKLRLEELDIPVAEKYRVYGSDGFFFGIGKRDEEEKVLRVDKNLY